MSQTVKTTGTADTEFQRFLPPHAHGADTIMTPEQEELREERVAIICACGLTQEVAEEVADRWPELYGIRVRTIKQGELL